eukprot:IDg9640t1
MTERVIIRKAATGSLSARQLSLGTCCTDTGAQDSVAERVSEHQYYSLLMAWRVFGGGGRCRLDLMRAE